ncbi:MAG: methionine--tRNA ligase [Myxococcota bacterium]
MTRPFYITTPIYYVNDKPHIGHAYTTVAVDVFARYQRLRGHPVRFLTGTDEHGQKIETSAAQQNAEPRAFVDRMSAPFREAFHQLDCQFDDFIRTTEPRHEERVRRLWKTIADKGDIYLGAYEGWYSVADEAFVTETELEGLDPVTRSKVQRVEEPSYFFRLSAYGDALLEFYEANPDFVQPAGRYNEVKSFVRHGLKDLSVSRTSFTWGIPVPGDDDHVMYVWFDALSNYLTALGGPAAPGEEPLLDAFWTPNDARVVHVVGKDILRFHAIIWPACLLAAGITPPRQVWAHGWLTINGEKMSKRLGNFIPPGPLVEGFGADVVRYYLMREVAFGQDGDFSHRNVLARYRGELANGLGNLLHRILASIVKKSLGGVVPEPVGAAQPEDETLVAAARKAAKDAAAHLDAMAPHRALDAIWELVGAANTYVDQTAPWALAKRGETERLHRVTYHVLESLRWLSVMIAPFMPGTAAALRAQLGLDALAMAGGRDEGPDAWPASWGELAPGTTTRPGDPLFPRIDPREEAALLARFGVAPAATPNASAAAAPATTAPHPDAADPSGGGKSKKQRRAEEKARIAELEPPDGYISFDAFARVSLRVGRIDSAAAVPKSDKLVRLTVDLGEARPRQILAGIREHYPPEALVGKRVTVVTNLEPRKIMGQLSEGMVLAASDDEHGLSVLAVDKDIDPGTVVS